MSYCVLSFIHQYVLGFALRLSYCRLASAFSIPVTHSNNVVAVELWCAEAGLPAEPETHQIAFSQAIYCTEAHT